MVTQTDQNAGSEQSGEAGGEGLDAVIRLFDMDRENSGEGGGEEETLMTEPASVSEDADVLTPNLHMGSANPTLAEMIDERDTEFEDLEEDLGVRAYEVRVTAQQLSDALSSGIENGQSVFIPVDLSGAVAEGAQDRDVVIFSRNAEDGEKAPLEGRDAVLVDGENAGAVRIELDVETIEELLPQVQAGQDLVLTAVVFEDSQLEELDDLPVEILPPALEELAEETQIDDQPQRGPIERVTAEEREFLRQQEAAENQPQDTRAQRPELETFSAGGDEDTAIALEIDAALRDTDGSESLTVTLGGVPDGSVLSAGTDLGSGQWRIEPDELEGLTLTPPLDFFGRINLSVTATSTESNGGDETSITRPLVVRVEEVKENVVEGGGGSERLNGSEQDDLVQSGDGNDTVRSGGGSDQVEGGSGRDNLSGEAGDDTLDGGTGDDRLYGGTGDDTLIGGEGRDQLYGGDGNDTLVIGDQDANDGLSGGDGIDRIIDDNDGDIQLGSFRNNNTIEIVDGGDSESRVLGTEGNNTLDFRNAELRNISEVDAGAGNDTVHGSSGSDQVVGNVGNDRLYGREGDDTLGGGVGNDQLYGGEGSDNLDGGTGNDRLDGGEGSDTVVGGEGNDQVYGGAGEDQVEGGVGDDRVYGGAGDDQVSGGEGKDSLYGNEGTDNLSGGAGDDRLYGGDGNDTLQGGEGRDTLDGGAGDDTLILGDNDITDGLKGGDGIDRIVDDNDGDFQLASFSNRNTIEIVDGGDTESRVLGTDANNTLDFRNAELRNISEVDGGAGNDTVYGSQAGDQLSGNVGNDRLYGQGGDDSLAGGEGNDSLYGESGVDVVDGGAGADRVYGGDGNDTVSGGADNDQVYGQAGDDQLFGGTGDDRLYGGDGNDTLQGGEGRDTLDGGAGDDTLILGDDDATDSLKGGEGTDRIVDDNDGDFQLASFSNRNTIEIVDGGDTESRVLGTDANNTLDFRNAELRNISEVDGGAGNDSITGTSADDTLKGNTGADRLYGLDGADTLDGGTGADRLYGGTENDHLSGGEGNDQLYGEAGDDQLIGGAGDDRLSGGDGNDTLQGGEGKDTLDGGAGDDTLVLDAHGAQDGLKGGAGTDRVIAADDGDLQIASFRNNNTVEIVDGGTSASRVLGTDANNTLDFRNAELRNITEVDGGAGNDSITGTASGDTLKGNTGADRLYGLAGDDTLEGGTGNDQLYGGEGNDRLVGGSGNDRLDGGAGDDILVIESGVTGDALQGGTGTDTLITADGGDISLTGFNSRMGIERVDGGDTSSDILGTAGRNALDFRGIELTNIDSIDAGANHDTVYGNDSGNALLGGDGNDRLYGEGGNDRLDGGSGADRLYGGAGDDTIDSGTGNDQSWGGDGNDIFTFGAGDGKDRVNGGEGWLDTVRLENSDGTAPDPADWTLDLKSGSVTDQGEEYIELSSDAAGKITFNDGSELQFDNLERIDW